MIKRPTNIKRSFETILVPTVFAVHQSILKNAVQE